MSLQINTSDLNETVEGSQAPEGHNEAMAQKYDESLAAGESQGESSSESKGTEEGEKILGKFKSVEDLTAAYQELEKKLGSGEAKPNEEPEVTPPEKQEEGEAEELAQKAAEDAGLDIEAIQNHFYAEGELSEDHYEALAKNNIPKEVVDQYLAGVKASAAQMESEVYEVAGGEERFSQISEWASSSLDNETLGAYNAAAESGNVAQIKMALQAVVSMYEKANPKAPSLVSGKVTGNTTQGYQSQAQMVADMSKPEYRSDPAFRDMVAAKLKASNF